MTPTLNTGLVAMPTDLLLQQCPDPERDWLAALLRDGIDIEICRMILSQLTDADSVGGRLVQFADAWRSTISDDWVLDTVTQGVTFEFMAGEPAPNSPPRELPLSANDYAACSSEVEEMKMKRAIERLSTDPSDSFYNRIFPVKKKDGGTRPVIDCRELNLSIPKVRFKMESLASVKTTLRRRDWMVKVDIKDAYFHLMINRAHRRFLRFHWDGLLYEFRALPFGVTSAPRIFTKVMRPVVGLLRAQGIRCLIYLDDLLIMADSKEQCVTHLRQALSILMTLGFKINWKKSALIPSQVMQFLGLTLDSHEMMFRVPPDKLANINTALRNLFDRRSTTQRQLARLIGKLMAIESAVLPVRLRTRELLRNLNHHKGSDWDMRVPIWRASREEMQWWIDHLSTWNGRAIVAAPPTVHITTDASDSGWGAVYEDRNGTQTTYGFWSLLQRSYGNNVRELLAGGFGLLSFASLIEGETVDLQMDNTTAVAYVNHMGGRRDFLSLIAEDLWDWCIGRQVTVIARHLAGVLNVRADRLSRIVTDRSDWKLNPAIFDILSAQWGPFSMDLFATALNAQLPRFVSWKPQPGAYRVDAFSIAWNDIGTAWANPPFILIGRILTKVRKEQATMVIVVPVWPTQYWWPTLLHLLADQPVLLPNVPQLYLPGNLGNEAHRDAPSWSSIAALISGSSTKRAAFQRELWTYFPDSGAQALSSLTSTSGDVSRIGSTSAVFPTHLLRQLEW